LGSWRGNRGRVSAFVATLVIDLGLGIDGVAFQTHRTNLFFQADAGGLPANLGSLALEANDLPKAIEFLKSALQIDADLHQARFNLARALARLGRRTEALEEARILLERLPAQAKQRPEVERLIEALR